MTGRRWRPQIVDYSNGSGFGGALPKPGMVIAGWGTRNAWRVLSVDEVQQANWHEETVARWQRAGCPDPETWPGRERRIRVEPARNPAPNGRDRKGLPLYPWAPQEQWWPLPDPYPACVDCGLLWPCPCDDRNRETVEAMAELERLGAVLPGCCWACGDPVTGRQHAIEFPGENLLLPGAGPALFHTSHSRKAARGRSGNQTCRGEAGDYERRWVDAGPGRRPRLTCPGSMFLHFGYSECTSGPDCPGVDATHPSRCHCTTASYSESAAEHRPLTNCGERGCRGPKPLPAVAADESPLRNRRQP